MEEIKDEAINTKYVGKKNKQCKKFKEDFFVKVNNGGTKIPLIHIFVYKYYLLQLISGLSFVAWIIVPTVSEPKNVICVILYRNT